MDKQYVISLFKEGKTSAEIAKELKTATHVISEFRNQLGFPHANLCVKFNNENFKKLSIEIYNKPLKIKEIIKQINDLKLLGDTKFSQQRLSEWRNYYNLEPKMFERVYTNDSDRIKGYMIRNSKFMAKRRGIPFHLNYNDFEIPLYCPILKIKLKYLGEDSNGNSPDHATLDRIDNSKGYIKGNVIVISRLANAMKNQATFEELELFSENILKVVRYYKNQGALGSITDVFENIDFKLSLDS